MLAHAHMHPSLHQMSETELFVKIQSELINRYGVDGKLASEMALRILATTDHRFLQ